MLTDSEDSSFSVAAESPTAVGVPGFEAAEARTWSRLTSLQLFLPRSSALRGRQRSQRKLAWIGPRFIERSCVKRIGATSLCPHGAKKGKPHQSFDGGAPRREAGVDEGYLSFAVQALQPALAFSVPFPGKLFCPERRLDGIECRRVAVALAAGHPIRLFAYDS
jgi:hypothetical protein